MADSKLQILITAQDRASSQIKSINGSLSKLDNGVNSIVSSFAKVATVAAASLTTALGFAVKSAASYEMNRVAFETMLGSAKEAQGMLKQISDFAAKTPFEVPDVVDAGKQLLAFGFTAKEIIPNIRTLGDVSAGLGVPLGDMIYLFGTLKSQGRAYTKDIMQFAQRGVPIFDELAKVMGTTKDKVQGLVEEGKVGFPEVQKAFQNMTGAGGKFGGLMDKQSKTLSGVFSNLKDNVGRLAREMLGMKDTGDIVKGSFYDKLSIAAQNLLVWLDQNKVAIQKFATEALNKLVITTENVFKWIVDHREDIIGAITTIAKMFGSVISFFAEHKNALYAVIGAYIALKAAIIIGNVAGAITSIASVMSATIPIAGSLTTALGILSATMAVSLGVAAAASIYYLYTQIKKANAAANDLVNNTNRLMKVQSFSTEQDILIAKHKKGQISDAQYKAQMNAIWAKKGYAAGGSISSRNPVMVGEKGAEVFVPNTAGQIIPNKNLGIGGNTNTTINMNIGVYAGTEVEKRRIAKELYESLKQIASAQNKSVAQVLGG